MSDNTIDNNIDAIRREFKLLDHWIYLNAADQTIPGNYWLSAAREFYKFQEYGRMEDIPTADIATHPFLLVDPCLHSRRCDDRTGCSCTTTESGIIACQTVAHSVDAPIASLLLYS